MEQDYTIGKNISKLLKYAPKGTMLYSPLVGSCTLVRVSDDRIVVSNLSDTQHYGFDWSGRYWTGMGECLLYPSQDHKSWDGWQNELFGKGDIVVREGVGTYIVIDEHKTMLDKDGTTRYANRMCDGTPLASVCRYATPQEARAFMTVLERKGYRWDDQKKEMVLCKPKDEAPKHKYDIVAGGLYVAKSTQYFGDKYVAFNKGSVYRSDADGYITDSHGESVFIGNCGGDFCSVPKNKMPNATNTDGNPNELPPIITEGNWYVSLRTRQYGDEIDAFLAGEAYNCNADGYLVSEHGSTIFVGDNCGKDFRPAEPNEIPTVKLKPFDQVLVRDSEGAEWDASIFKHYDKDDAIYRYRCMDSGWAMCIPYNNETRKLLGTRDNCDKKYVTWKV